MAKYLGVFIDTNMSFFHQIRHTVDKASVSAQQIDDCYTQTVQGLPADDGGLVSHVVEMWLDA